MASRTGLLETIANGFLARREELAEEMTAHDRALPEAIPADARVQRNMLAAVSAPSRQPHPPGSQDGALEARNA
jgi:hypothetical protein